MPAGGEGMLTITDAEFRRLADYIKNYGIYLKDSKSPCGGQAEQFAGEQKF